MTSNIRYKVTDQNLQTYNNTQWILGEKKTTSGAGKLCSPGWLHCYSDPLLAVFLNPIHAGFLNPRLFRAEVGGRCLPDNGLKEGWTEMTLLEELALPTVTLEQRIAFAILCVKEVYQDPRWIDWADKWLSGEDRDANSAYKVEMMIVWPAASCHLDGPAARRSLAAVACRSARGRRAATAAATAAALAASITKFDLVKLAKEAMKY